MDSLPPARIRHAFAAALLLAQCACGDTGTAPSPDDTSGVPWSAPRTVATLPPTSLVAPRIAGRGSAVVAVWAVERAPGELGIESSRLVANAWTPTVRLGPGAPVLAEPVVGIDDAGRAVAAWVGPDPDPAPTRFRECLWVASTDPSGAWSEAEPIACDVEAVRLAVSPRGDALVAWSSPFYRNDALPNLWTARRPTGGPWSDLRRAGAGRGMDTTFSVAIDANGLGAVAWAQGSGLDDDLAIFLATGYAGEDWNVRTIVPGAPNQRRARVAFEIPAVPVVAWQGIGGGIRAVRVTDSISVQQLTSNIDDTCLAAAGSGAGASALSWWRLNDSPGIFAAFGSGGRWEPERVRGFPSQSPLACPAIAMDGIGNAVVAWRERSAVRGGEVWATARYGGVASRWLAATRLDPVGEDPAVAIADGVAYVVRRSGLFDDPGGVSLREARLPLTSR
jgi:hypothetical protein